LVGALICALAGVAVWWQQYKKSPAYALALVVDAAERNDAAAFDEVFDTNRVVDTFIPQVTEKAVGRYASSLLTDSTRRRVESLVPQLMPGISEIVRDQMMRRVRTLAASAAGKPFPLVALAMPRLFKIEEAGDTAKAARDEGGAAIELTLARDRSGRWKVVAVKDASLAANFVEQIAKDLPSISAPVEKEIRRQLDKTFPEGLPDLPLLNNK
jgi:hypothetical protein